MITTRALDSYVEKLNQWYAIFDRNPLSLHSPNDRKTIARTIMEDIKHEETNAGPGIPPVEVRLRCEYLARCGEELSDLEPGIFASITLD